MTARIFAMGAVALVIAASTAFSYDPQQADLETRVAELEKELETARAEVQEAQKAVDDQQKLLEQVVSYLETQAKSAKAMEKTLDQSEKAGFTFGINPESRKVMLSGWRSQLATAQKDVPSTKPAGKKEAPKRSRYWSTRGD